jgi:hypothetical protein
LVVFGLDRDGRLAGEICRPALVVVESSPVADRASILSIFQSEDGFLATIY